MSRRRSDGQDDPLAQTVTPGDLALGVALSLEETKKRSGMGKSPKKVGSLSPVIAPVVQKQTSNLIALDSPFLSEPLVDASLNENDEGSKKPAQSIALEQSMLSTASTTEAYVSASTSLRSSLEIPLGARFEEMWKTSEKVKARGWSEDAVDVVMRRLQGAGMQMDVLDADDAPFEGEMNIQAAHSTIILIWNR